VWFGDEEAQASADEIEHFLTGTRHAVVSDRILATVLFTDIVGSTQRAPALGDGAWQSLLAHHDNLVREEVERHRGRFVKSLGDGALAVFERPEPGDQIRMSMVRCGPPWQSLRRSDACDRRARRRCLAA
jgi:class 3 adenylate cyclase